MSSIQPARRSGVWGAERSGLPIGYRRSVIDSGGWRGKGETGEGQERTYRRTSGIAGAGREGGRARGGGGERTGEVAEGRIVEPVTALEGDLLRRHAGRRQLRAGVGEPLGGRELI